MPDRDDYRFFLPSLLWAAVVGWGLLWPFEVGPDDLSWLAQWLPDWLANALEVGADKVVHASLFFSLCVLLRLGWMGLALEKQRRRQALTIALVVSASYGALLEVGQYFVPERSFDLLDIVANSLGAWFGTLLPGSWLGRLFRSR